MSVNTVSKKIHLWLGIVSAPLVFFVCITGSILVFSDEIIDFSAGKARYVQAIKSERLPAETLLQTIKLAFPERGNPSYMVVYKDPQRSVRVNTFHLKLGLRMVYIDPYTAEILKDDATIHFFYVMAHLHNSLLLHTTGEWIIDITTLVFVLALITGLILWWPKRLNSSAIRYAFSFKWKQSFAALNFDTHRVIGMYTTVLLLVLSITGLLIAFKPMFALTVHALGGNGTVKWNQHLPAHTHGKESYPVNRVMDALFVQYPEKKEIQISTFFNDKWGYYACNVAEHIGLKSAMNNQFVVVDRYTGQQIALPHVIALTKDVDNVIWTLHMGNWMGLWGKILTFLAGLFASFLPISGLLIWIPKLRKKKA